MALNWADFTKTQYSEDRSQWILGSGQWNLQIEKSHRLADILKFKRQELFLVVKMHNGVLVFAWQCVILHLFNVTNIVIWGPLIFFRRGGSIFLKDHWSYWPVSFKCFHEVRNVLIQWKKGLWLICVKIALIHRKQKRHYVMFFWRAVVAIIARIVYLC